MTLERNAEGLIKPPAAFAAAQQQKAEWGRTMGELREWLEGEHQKALAEDPYRSFKMKTPLDLLQKLPPDERERIAAHEEQTFARLQRGAKDVHEKRRMWTAAGGSEESFEDHWALGGEHEHNAARAAEVEERARRSSSIY
jgi:hypothetical protein